MSASPQAAACNRMQPLMSSSPVPAISTELPVTADGDLNRELMACLIKATAKQRLPATERNQAA
ncbi:MAG: hypothetical protein ACKVOI_12360 [Dongiaceae bacterium]